MTSTFKLHNSQMASVFSIDDYELRLYSSMEEAATAWSHAAPEDNIFLQTTYLSAIESAPPKGMQFRYLVFFKENEAIGVVLCQIQYFKADKSLNLDEDPPSPCFFNTFGRYFRGLLASKVEFYTLLCGNLLLTGEHGYYFKTAELRGAAGVALISKALSQVITALSKQKISISAILVKDIYEKNKPNQAPMVNSGYNEFTIQPSMVLELDDDWKTYEDYLGAMSSKYRVRSKKAVKKAKEVVKKEMGLEEIEAQLPRIYELYQEIAKNSGFNVVNLNRNYLLELKRRMPDQFCITGYYFENKLIAYYTTILNGKELEAHFLGFDHEYSRDMQIYLNILLDIARKGIECQVRHIVYARTALEIKSSVGAEAQEMYCYMRHRNAFSNRFMKPILEYLRPTEPWEPRRPFKDRP